jgi:hypothetical protein
MKQDALNKKSEEERPNSKTDEDKIKPLLESGEFS